MKLYFSPGACSLSPHIALHETGLAHETVKVDLKAKTTADGSNFLSVNPKGQVPTFVTAEGVVLTEGPAIVQYIADRAPQSGLAPANGTIERYQLQQWLNFISTELHKSFSPLFNPATPDAYKTMARETIAKRFAHVDSELAGKSFLTGPFTVADGYLFVMLRWADAMSVDISSLRNLVAFKERVAARPAVQAAMKHEGLI